MANKTDTKTSKSKRLGRGLDALLGGAPISLVNTGQAYATDRSDFSAPLVSETIQEIALDQIDVNPWQPRSQFEQNAMEDLAQSIRELGIITPITVRRSNGGRYQIVSGERRYKAAHIAQLDTIPAYIITTDDRNMQVMAIVENIQREDLNVIDIAIAYQNLMDEYNLTQDNISDIIGKKRGTVANFLRLLKLPADIQNAVRDQTLSMGHAKVLMGVDNAEVQKSIAKKIIAQELSVRQTEDLVKKFAPHALRAEKASETINEEMLEMLTLLKETFDKCLHGKASIKQTAKGGTRITLDLDSSEDVQYMITKLTSED